MPNLAIYQAIAVNVASKMKDKSLRMAHLSLHNIDFAIQGYLVELIICIILYEN